MKKTTGIDEYGEPQPRRKTLSLLSLTEKHEDAANSLLNQLLDMTTDKSQLASEHFSDDRDFHIYAAERIASKLDLLEQIALHLETSKTLLLTTTITHCPHCGEDIRNCSR